MPQKGLIGFIIVAGAAAAIGIAIWFSQRQPERYVGSAEKITVGAYTGDTAALIWIADAKGYFADSGLDVTIKGYEAGKLATDALLADEVDISSAAGFVLVNHSFYRDDLRVLGTIAEADVNWVVARRDHGISEPSDLNGRKIGVTKGSTGEFFLGLFLTFNGLSLQDVEVLDLKPSEITEAVSKGEIDAGLSWEPNIYPVKDRLGSNAVSWSAQCGQEFYFLLIGKEAWIRGHPEAVERFLRALIRAEQFVEAHDPEAQKIIGDRFEYDRQYMQRIWPLHSFMVTLPQALLLSLEDQARWMMEANLVEAREAPNYLEFMYWDALEKVKPGAVTVIH